MTGSMSHHIKIEKFEGPLDLLLQLIQARKLPINEVALSEVTEQYGQLISTATIPAEEVADFLVIAAKLIYLKSRTLLPELELETEPNEISLAEQLKIYKLYRDKLELIERLWLNDAIAVPRPKTASVWVRTFRPPETVSLEELKNIMLGAIAKLVPPQKVFKQLVERAVSLHDKIRDLLRRVKGKMDISFWQFVGRKADKADVIVSFLALLELTKQQSIVAEQHELFDDITVRQIVPHSVGLATEQL